MDPPMEQDLPANDILQHFPAETTVPCQLDFLQGRAARAVLKKNGGIFGQERAGV